MVIDLIQILSTKSLFFSIESDVTVIGERAKPAKHSQVCTIENRGYIMVRAISVYSAGVPYAACFTAAVKIPLPSATFQF